MLEELLRELAEQEDVQLVKMGIDTYLELNAESRKVTGRNGYTVMGIPIEIDLRIEKWEIVTK